MTEPSLTPKQRFWTRQLSRVLTLVLLGAILLVMSFCHQGKAAAMGDSAATSPVMVALLKAGKSGSARYQANLAGLPITPAAHPQALPPAMLFVSFSLPGRLLKQYLVEAHQYGIPLVLRGLYHNQFPATARKIFNLTKQTQTGGMSINPHAFLRFHITAVPTLVVLQRPLSCQTAACPTPPYDVMAGNISLKEALTTIAQSGTAARETAKRLLQRQAEANG